MALEHVSRDGLRGKVGKEFNQLHGTVQATTVQAQVNLVSSMSQGEPGFYSEMKGRHLEQSPG